MHVEIKVLELRRKLRSLLLCCMAYVVDKALKGSKTFTNKDRVEIKTDVHIFVLKIFYWPWIAYLVQRICHAKH